MSGITAQRLVELNNFSKLRAKAEHPTRDTSQNGDWECFRNETYNNQPVRLTSGWFRKLPAVGKLHFDFVVIVRPVAGMRAIEEAGFKRLLMCVFPVVSAAATARAAGSAAVAAANNVS